MNHVIIVHPRLADQVPKGKTYFFLGYQNGMVQTTDRLDRAAVVPDELLAHLVESLRKKSGHNYTTRVSESPANWTMQRLRAPKKIHAGGRRTARHYPKLRAVRKPVLTTQYAAYCAV